MSGFENAPGSGEKKFKSPENILAGDNAVAADSCVDFDTAEEIPAGTEGVVKLILSMGICVVEFKGLGQRPVKIDSIEVVE